MLLLNLPLNHLTNNYNAYIFNCNSLGFFLIWSLTALLFTQFNPFLSVHKFIHFLCKLALQLLFLLTYLSWTSYFTHFVYNQEASANFTAESAD